MITEIRHRYTNAALWSGEAESLRDAVAKAVSAGANLTDAYLTGADLTDANLTGADLAGADLIDGGQRSDGYRFVGSIRNGALWIKAGCRFFSLAEGREHWTRTRGGTPLGAETTAIMDHIEAVAKIRGMVP